MEPVVLSFFGGLLGLAVGIGGAYVTTTALKLPFLYPSCVFELGVLVAVIVGVVAGVYPANKAAKLAPVDVLRHE